MLSSVVIISEGYFYYQDTERLQDEQKGASACEQSSYSIPGSARWKRQESPILKFRRLALKLAPCKSAWTRCTFYIGAVVTCVLANNTGATSKNDCLLIISYDDNCFGSMVLRDENLLHISATTSLAHSNLVLNVVFRFSDIKHAAAVASYVTTCPNYTSGLHSWVKRISTTSYWAQIRGKKAEMKWLITAFLAFFNRVFCKCQGGNKSVCSIIAEHCLHMGTCKLVFDDCRISGDKGYSLMA